MVVRVRLGAAASPSPRWPQEPSLQTVRQKPLHWQLLSVQENDASVASPCLTVSRLRPQERDYLGAPNTTTCALAGLMPKGNTHDYLNAWPTVGGRADLAFDPDGQQSSRILISCPFRREDLLPVHPSCDHDPALVLTLSGAAKLELNSSLVAFTKSRMPCFAAPLFHEGEDQSALGLAWRPRRPRKCS